MFLWPGYTTNPTNNFKITSEVHGFEVDLGVVHFCVPWTSEVILKLFVGLVVYKIQQVNDILMVKDLLFTSKI